MKYKPKTREEMIEETNRRIYKKIEGITYRFATLSEEPLVIEELENQSTNSDEWYALAEQATCWEFPEDHKEIAADLYTIAKLVMNRNAYHDGIPFCPLCGKLGKAEHNGAPIIEARVCGECNNRKIIPARIRALQDLEK